MSDVPTADSIGAAGAVEKIANGATVASVTIPAGSPSARYRVTVTTYQTGTVDTTRLANLILTHGGTTVGTLLSTGLATKTTFESIVVGADTDISVKAGAAFAAASFACASIVATRMD